MFIYCYSASFIVRSHSRAKYHLNWNITAEFGIEQRKITAITSFKVTDFGTNRKPVCDFLLVINTNLHIISQRFQVVADYWSNLRFRQGVPLFHILVRDEIPVKLTTNKALNSTELIQPRIFRPSPTQSRQMTQPDSLIDPSLGWDGNNLLVRKWRQPTADFMTQVIQWPRLLDQERENTLLGMHVIIY